MLYGFVAGVLAGNYDITELFIDGILKIVDHNMDAAAKVLAEIDKYFEFDKVSEPAGKNFVSDKEPVPEGKNSVVDIQTVVGILAEDYILPYSFRLRSLPFHFGIPDFHIQVGQFLLGIPFDQAGSSQPGRAYFVDPYLIGIQIRLFLFLLGTRILD